MTPDGVVTAINVTADRLLGLGIRLKDGASVQLGFRSLEEGLDSGVVEAIAFLGQ
ncbi:MULTISPECIES: hypothetical protein [Microvirga]|uniref:hypothetical protein n=1 Tax=Microvirga TaxID=186650 RepID=UPI001B371929|nr:hypothetical protein [Microvirga sp. HBU67558]